jgi:hypothetical protein
MDCTVNEGPVRIQYKCLVPIYVFPELKRLFPKQNYNVLSPSSYTHISVRDLYISRTVCFSAAGSWNIQGASKIKLKNVNKKRMATARKLIFFGISQGIHC